MEVNKLDMKLSRLTSQKKKEVATRYRADDIDNTVMHCAKLQNFMHNMQARASRLLLSIVPSTSL